MLCLVSNFPRYISGLYLEVVSDLSFVEAGSFLKSSVVRVYCSIVCLPGVVITYGREKIMFVLKSSFYLGHISLCAVRRFNGASLIVKTHCDFSFMQTDVFSERAYRIPRYMVTNR